MRHIMEHTTPPTGNPSLPEPRILDLSNPEQVRTLADPRVAGDATPVYWISPRPPERLLGALPAAELEGAWISADGIHAVCRIGQEPAARVRLPAELEPSEISAFLRQLIRIRLASVGAPGRRAIRESKAPRAVRPPRSVAKTARRRTPCAARSHTV